MARRGQPAGLPRLDDPLPHARRVRGRRADRVPQDQLRPQRHADDARPGVGHRGAGGRRPRPGPLLRPGGDRPFPARLPGQRRPPADGGQRLPDDALLLREGAAPPRHRRHLLRPLRRRRHRCPLARQHPRRVRREPRLADVRGAGRPRHRRGRPRPRCRRDRRQHLGDAALLPPAGARRGRLGLRRDEAPGRPAT